MTARYVPSMSPAVVARIWARGRCAEERNEAVVHLARLQVAATMAAASRWWVLSSAFPGPGMDAADGVWRVSGKTSSWDELPVRDATRSSSAGNGALPRYCGAITSCPPRRCAVAVATAIVRAGA
jgi:hypothetical protein